MSAHGHRADTGAAAAVGKVLAGVGFAAPSRAAGEPEPGPAAAQVVDALRGSLDSGGRAPPKTVGAVADLVSALAQGVRGAKQAAE